VEAKTFTIKEPNRKEMSSDIYDVFAAGITVYLDMHGGVDYTSLLYNYSSKEGIHEITKDFCLFLLPPCRYFHSI
jgi:hypothetical protein